MTHPSAEYRCKLAGAQRNSFPSVVAGGADACVIHYLRNDKVHLSGLWQCALLSFMCQDLDSYGQGVCIPTTLHDYPMGRSSYRQCRR